MKINLAGNTVEVIGSWKARGVWDTETFAVSKRKYEDLLHRRKETDGWGYQLDRVDDYGSFVVVHLGSRPIGSDIPRYSKWIKLLEDTTIEIAGNL
jgi:hypothetical protein